MNPIVQQIRLQPNRSFTVDVFCTADIETGCQQHRNYELILFKKGNGKCYIDKYANSFEPGNIFFLGSNLPHKFDPGSEVSALIIHFRTDSIGSQFFNLPECQLFRQALQKARPGIKITGNACHLLQSMMQSFETATGSDRIILLLQCLQILAREKDYILLSKRNKKKMITTNSDCIDRVIRYTTDAFRDPISLSKVATIACKSIPSFCHYFKSRTKKTYINYLNEVRIAYACNQLLHSNKSVVDIGYESGYNTVAHFHRQFLRFKKTTPLQYRKSLSSSSVGSNLEKHMLLNNGTHLLYRATEQHY